MISEEVKQVAAKIGRFFLKEKNGDYNAACEEITRIRIDSLELDNNRLTIETSRPGLLIGKRGQRVDELQTYLGLSLHIVETKEEHIVDYIYPYKEIDEHYDFHTDYLDELKENCPVSQMIDESYDDYFDEMDNQYFHLNKLAEPCKLD